MCAAAQRADNESVTLMVLLQAFPGQIKGAQVFRGNFRDLGPVAIAAGPFDPGGAG